MEIETYTTPEEVAVRAADIVCNAVGGARPRIGLPTGNTPILMYEELDRRHAAGSFDASRTIVYAIDEFAGVPRGSPGTNAHFYAQHLRFQPRALHCPDSEASDPALHMTAYTDAIRQDGPLDLCVLGIGTNGHIAFNEPPSGIESRIRVVELAPDSRAAHATSFGALDLVPTLGMTLGVADLLEARTIIVLATGSAKAGIVKLAIHSPATSLVPASWLQTHSDVTWLLDAEAAAAL